MSQILRALRFQKMCASCQGGIKIDCMQVVAVHSLSEASGDIYTLGFNKPFVLCGHGCATKRTSAFTELHTELLSRLSRRMMSHV